MIDGQQPERVEVIAVDAAVEHLMASRRVGKASLNEEQRVYEAEQMREAYRDILTKALPVLARHRLTALTEAGRAGVADAHHADLIGRLRGNALLSRERWVDCNRIGDTAGMKLASQFVDEWDEAAWVISKLAAAPTPPAPATPAPDVLREALQPFADCCDQIADDESDEEWAKFRLLVKHYRAARAALSRETGK